MFVIIFKREWIDNHYDTNFKKTQNIFIIILKLQLISIYDCVDRRNFKIILNFILVPKFGYYGAAVSTLITYFLLTITVAYVANGLLKVNYEKFSSDLIKGCGEEEVEREKLVESLKKYLEHNNLTIDWDAINNSSTELLVNSLCILSPYKPREKQALLEAETLSKRSEMLIAMTEMSMTSGPSTEQIQ